MTLPSWQYKDPAEIMDRLIESNKKEAEHKQKMQLVQRRKNQRKIRSIMRKVRSR